MKFKFICLMVFLAAIFDACGPSGRVPVRFIGPQGITSNGIKCCDILCKGYDYCLEAGEKYENGVFYAECSCHDHPSSSSGSSWSENWSEDWSERYGMKDKPDKSGGKESGGGKGKIICKP